MKEKNKSKGKKGITLVSLVITIIVILILAGIAINLAMDEEGLIGKAEEAVESWNRAVGEESNAIKNIFMIANEIEGGGTGGEAEVEEANPPKLGEGMIPVYYENGWKKTDSSNKDKNWYEYDTQNKKWANAVTVKEAKREEYKAAGTGSSILEEDIIGMYVWIPRYAYKITKGYHPEEEASLPIEGEIEIQFLYGVEDKYKGGEAIRSNQTNGEEYVVHPAFTGEAENGGRKEITGFWVGKFEASSNTTTEENPNLGVKYGRTNNETDEITIRPNVTSWRAITVQQIYEACKRMTAEGNIHGLRGIEAHMMKNSEWGAIAYLTQSDYGNKQTNADANSGVWANPYHEGDIVENENATYKHNLYYTTMTGMVGSSRDEAISGASKAIGNIDKSNPDTISITYQNYAEDGSESGSPYTRTYYRYQTEEGQRGSSTGNIYGIYDLSGGAWEHMASYLTNGTTSYVEYFRNLEPGEKQEYAGTGEENNETDRKANYQANSNKYGDAIWETSRNDAGAAWNLSWNSDYANFPYLGDPFFLRGGAFYSEVSAGTFAFAYSSGSESSDRGFHPVLGV